MTLAVSLTLGVFSGLPPLRDATSITKEAEAANGVHKAWCWDTKDEFVKYVKKNYTNKYGTVFNANGGHVFTNGNLKINLAEKIPIPGTETKVCKWWWFTTVDKYGDSRSSSTGTTHKIYEDPKKGTSSGPNRWATQKLSASPKNNSAGSAANGTIFPCYELGGAKGKFKVDLGGTINNYGVSMYVINIERWLKNDTKKGFGKWPNKKTSNGNTIVTMFFNAITKTHHVGAGEHKAALPNLNTKKAWKKATANMGIGDRAEKSGDDFEYDQHYNIKVEFNFGKLKKIEKSSHLIIESRVANGSTTYAKTYTNSQFQWAGSKVVGDTQKANNRVGGFYKDVTSVKDKQFKKGSAFSVTKDLIDALSQNGQLLLRGVRLERYAVDKTKSKNDEDTSHQTIITKSYSKGQTSAAKKAGYEYGDVAHVYLTCDADTLRALAKDDKKTTKEFSKKNKNLEKGAVDKNSFETKDGKIKVEDEGKFYEIGGTKKDGKVLITKKSSGKTLVGDWDGGQKLGKTISYNDFLNYVCGLNFKIHPYEEYDKSKEKDKKVYEDHLVFIWERAVEPKLSMNTELVSYDSDSGKYEGTTSGDYALDVPMNKMSEDYDVAGTVEALGKLVPSNNDLTLESFLKGKIKKLIKTGDKYGVDYYYDRLLYSTGDAVPAILSDIRVSYTDKHGTKIVKSRTDFLDGLDEKDKNKIGWDPVACNEANTVKAIWKEEVTKKNEKGETEVETKSNDTKYYVWDGNNETIEKYLSRAKTLLTNSWEIKADLTKKMKITYVYVTPKTQTTQVNYVDVKSGDKTTTHFLITDNGNDKFSTSAKEGLSTAALHKVTSMLK